MQTAVAAFPPLVENAQVADPVRRFLEYVLNKREQGNPVVGVYCGYAPVEMIRAMGAVPVSLCAASQRTVPAAEAVLPANLCPMIKSSFGFIQTNTCFFFASSDAVIGETTCDGKKKAYEILGPLVTDLYVIDLHQTKSDMGRALLKEEYRRFAAKLESVSGKKITPDSLKKGIEVVNAKRMAVKRLAAIRAADPAPISGLDALLVNQVFFYDDPVRFTHSVNQLCDELEERVKQGIGVFAQGTTRVIVSGCPMAVPNWKLPMLIESSNAVIVGEESCVGERGTRWLTEFRGETEEDLLDALTERYFSIDCAVFTPNPSRVDYVKEMTKKLNAQGVIHYSLQFCQPHMVESGPVEKELEKSGIPTLRLETDYSQEDAGQLKTRIEAFVERLENK